MTKEQTQMIVGLIARAYPKHYANMTAQEKWEVVALYYDVFKDVDFNVMQSVVKQYIKTEHFPPAIADLTLKVEMIDTVQNENIFDDTIEHCISQSWRAISGEVEFKDLPEPAKAYWRSQQVIDALGYDENTSYSVVAGQMQRRLPEIIKMLKDEKNAYETLSDTHLIKGDGGHKLPIGFDENGKLIKALN